MVAEVRVNIQHNMMVFWNGYSDKWAGEFQGFVAGRSKKFEGHHALVSPPCTTNCHPGIVHIQIIQQQRARWETGRSKEQHAYKIAVEGVVLAQWDKSCVLFRRRGQASWAGITGAGEVPAMFGPLQAGRGGTARTLAYLGLGVWMGSGTVKGGGTQKFHEGPGAEGQETAGDSAQCHSMFKTRRTTQEMVESSPNRVLPFLTLQSFSGPRYRTGHWVLMKPEPNTAVTKLRRKQFGIPHSSPRSSYLSSDSKPRPGRARRKQIGDSGACIIPVPQRFEVPEGPI
ncbi:hypothetical protein B0H17DRAFT_1150385 [Mycena rosella]|uniref:Uncharacterized protein n=1 Tax=Mycena rosella TaxID=1033263 RepID=A0AAD7BT32_MYCRO|nr:hypothetical protein B0H17DRAFT_1150385 [Mycena rosella]